MKTGLFDENRAAFFSRLFNERLEDDYNDLLIMDESEVTGYIEPAKEYVEYVSTLIKKHLDAQEQIV
ncbi:MAG: hypothetical protein JWQ96_3438 [Segetibacter sp.]|nr:hypothetical protein [Segetibacter sp.]